VLGPAPHRPEAAAEQEKPCPRARCDGSGWLVDDEANTATPCECRDQRIRTAVTGRLRGTIPRRLRAVSFERRPVCDLDPYLLRPVRSYIDSLDEQLSAGRGLWFHGDVGTGKTSLALLVAKAARDLGRSVAIYSVPLLLAEIRRTYERDAGDTYLQLFRRLCSVDLLVLDDLGSERQTEWVLEQLYSLVNERWQDQRSLVVTTNAPDPHRHVTLPQLREELRQAIGELRGRMAGNADPDRLSQLVERVETVEKRLSELQFLNDADAVTQLRQQVGSRTVSRLVEICDDPILIRGPDLRTSTSGT
jgi:DNA replication protein DnaC